MTRARYAMTAIVLLQSIASCKKDDIVENKVPVADAGSSKTITLPDSVMLTGTGADADGKVVAYLWSQVSGPATSTIVNAGDTSTIVTFNGSGNYVFQLRITDDKGATGVDTMMVVVNPVPVTNTLTLQPAFNQDEPALLLVNGVDYSAGQREYVEVNSWSDNRYIYTIRAGLKFDLSSIPATATIKSAHLYLYSEPHPLDGNAVDANYGPSNAFVIQQVTAPWIGLRNWTNQPTASSNSQVVVAHTNQSQLDVDVDVTGMIGQMVNNNANYGFFLKLQNEVSNNYRIFVSSQSTKYPLKRPKLVVVYQ